MGTDFTRWVHQPAPSQYAPAPTEETSGHETVGLPGRKIAGNRHPEMREPDVPPPPAGNSCRRIEADFLTTADGRVCIFFPFKGMSKRIAKTFFGSGFFEIREAFTLPEHVMVQFPSGASPVIPVGYYPVVVSKTGYSVIF